MMEKIFKIIIVIFFAAFTFGFVISKYAEYTLTKNYKITTENYTVKPGDTLMKICIKYKQHDYRNPYILEYIEEIKKLNPNFDNNLRVGDELKIQYMEKLK